ncbi:MAG: NifB/NifX family molybdenum-iron cluster-binding protein [Bacteroidota bacterium]
MKIAVATNDHQHVTGHIGRCRSFMVFDVAEGKILGKELRNNTFTSHGSGGEHRHDHHHGEGAGQQHIRLIEGLKDCSHLISSGGGWRVVEDLKANKIVTVFTDEKDITIALEKFLRGELVENADLVCREHA